MLTQSTSISLLALSLALAGCSSQNNDATSGGEDQGQFPDTTATEPNAILPSDDAAADTTSMATGGPASSSDGAAQP